MGAHLPQLAKCVNGREREFVLLCEARGIPIPEPNEPIGRFRPDMLWEDRRLIVELDGPRAHSTPAQLASDAKRAGMARVTGLHGHPLHPRRSATSPRLGRGASPRRPRRPRLTYRASAAQTAFSSAFSRSSKTSAFPSGVSWELAETVTERWPFRVAAKNCV